MVRLVPDLVPDLRDLLSLVPPRGPLEPRPLQEQIQTTASAANYGISSGGTVGPTQCVIAMHSTLQCSPELVRSDPGGTTGTHLFKLADMPRADARPTSCVRRADGAPGLSHGSSTCTHFRTAVQAHAHPSGRTREAHLINVDSSPVPFSTLR